MCHPPLNLPHREELHLQTLKAFVDLHEFSDLNLVQALRSAPLHFTPTHYDNEENYQDQD